MYEITRKQSRIKDTLRLYNAEQTASETIEIDIDIDKLGAKIQKALEALGQVQKTLQEDPKSERLVEEYGQAIIALFAAIFGEDNAERIITFYEGNETEMLLDIFPYIHGIILPRIKEASAARKEQLKQAANLARRK